MNRGTSSARWTGGLIAAAMVAAHGIAPTRAATTVFFDGSQTTNFVASGQTSETLASEGYVFTVTRDKLFTGGVGLTNPIGRAVRVPWPQGLEAQAVTAGPSPGSARLVVTRLDRQPFAIESFAFNLLADTAGAGASLEVMPLRNGEDAFPDPLMFDATGHYGNSFAYSPSTLAGFEAYSFSLYVDFAFMRLTAVDTTPEAPLLTVAALGNGWLEISWPASAVGFSLESSSNLPTTGWSPVTNAVVSNGDLSIVQVEVSASRQFYRLRN